jgi:rhodanese-related sulfurtransferase
MSGIFSLSPKELKKWLGEGSAILIDVREKNEHDQNKIDGSHLIALSSFESNKVPQTDKKIVFYCRSGQRSLDAAKKFFQETKKECYNLEGGIIAWNNEHL